MRPEIRSMPIPSTSGGRTHWYSGWPRPPGLVVLHIAATGTARYTHEVLLKRGLSVHCTIERDGVVYRHVEDGHRCLHVGPGEWGGRGSLNSRALGIEIVNFGRCSGEWSASSSPHPVFDWQVDRPDDPEVLPEASGRRWWRDETYSGRTTRVVTRQLARRVGLGPGEIRDHRPGPRAWWCAFPDAQVEAVAWQVAEWVTRFGILPEHVVGHEHVSPGRKTDPGPAFPWRTVHAKLQASLEERAPHLLDPEFRTRDRTRALQSHLARFGMPVGDIDGWWGPRTEAATDEALGRFGEVYGWSTDLRAVPEAVPALCRAFTEVPGEAA